MREKENQFRQELPPAETAPWPTKFLDPVAAIRNFREILDKIRESV